MVALYIAIGAIVVLGVVFFAYKVKQWQSEGDELRARLDEQNLETVFAVVSVEKINVNGNPTLEVAVASAAFVGEELVLLYEDDLSIINENVKIVSIEGATEKEQSYVYEDDALTWIEAEFDISTVDSSRKLLFARHK